ncbi:hypothetical protein RND61_29485 [Streptomyces sp. TRM76323]|uniref:Gram-positive cocci surface proteins LPxTG domain-containing protein n=1 Tax=Streptomyces tamarix TaxID=3078565 RepID=A0ABU3QTR3_9ACTN|nr:hypothetical protein [Streptomyces tamarix]MDT9686168.1 hypothetical protein [Streptomyces tamarix]
MPGANGDVKIHSVGTPPLDQRSESQVCRFYLAAFDFTGLRQVSYTLSPQPLEADSPTAQGTIAITPTGTGQTTELKLPDGQYRLSWSYAGAGSERMKVFRVDCPNGGGGSGGDGRGPRGGVGAGGGGMATVASMAGSAPTLGAGAALAAGLAGTAGLILVRRRRRADGAA